MYPTLLCLLYSLSSAIAHDIEVNVKQGMLLGTTRVTVFDGKLYYAFFGVPYARPPIGELRFKDPKPPKAWESAYDARTEYHGACAQAHIVHKHGVYGYEDCLNLNIFTPSIHKHTKLKAVIVWIHGYAYTSSFSHIFGPDFVIDNDVIFITVTYRIGAFGFLKANQSDSNSNMGLKDIAMALKWIKRNIKQFCGDKDNVTVMGSGSSATMVALLSTTKYNKLFSKIILQSGTLFSPSLFNGNHHTEKQRLEDKLKSKGYNNVNVAPMKHIVELSQKIYTSEELMNKQIPLIPFLPILEEKSNKSLLSRNRAEYLDTSSFISKPMLIGFNTQESLSEVIPFLHNPHYLNNFAKHFKFMVPFSSQCSYDYDSTIYKKIVNKIKRAYFKDGISERSTETFLRYTSDLIKYPIYDFIQKYLQSNRSRLYVYKFNYSGQFNAVKATSIAGANLKVKGAASGDEICYILKCEPIWENYVKLNRDQNNRDRQFIKQITEWWANFAKAGNPTPNTYMGNVTWPPITLKDDSALNIGKVVQVGDTKMERRMYQFWNGIYREYYENCRGRDEL